LKVLADGDAGAETAGVVGLRTHLRPGDIGWIVYRHGVLYAQEYGFDLTFEAYVAGPLAEFARSAGEGERLWIAEGDGGFAGCIAIVRAAAGTAQLRWFLVEPGARGRGLGRRLLSEALAFCRECGYASVILWTVRALEAASHLYRCAGFRKVEEKRGRQWGVEVVEEKYELDLRQRL
jgi:GNAT superfamily N-acetyltransferase